MDIATVNLILTITMPILSNVIQELFRMCSRIKRSKCCNSNIEFKDDEPIKKENDKNIDKNNV